MGDLEIRAREILRSIVPNSEPVDQGELLDFSTEYRAGIRERVKAGDGSVIGAIALVWSTLRLDRPRQAKEMLGGTDFSALIEEDSTLSCANKSVAYAVLAEVLLLGADIPAASRAARSALHYARGKGTAAEAHHARGLLAAALALNGEIFTANEYLDLAHAKSEDFSDDDFRRWPFLLAILAIRTRQDGPALGKELADSSARPSISITVRGFRVYEEVVGRMLRGDFAGARTLCEVYRSRLDYPDAPELFTHLLLGAESLSLLQISQPGKVISLLKGARSPADHFVCYELLTASAYICLNNSRRALESIAPCVVMESTHSVSTRASVLVRKAVAKELLGEHDSADMAFFRAFHLAHREGAVVPPVGLPIEPLMALAERMKQREPQLTAAIEASNFKDYPHLSAEQAWCQCGDLTSRELELAEQLASGKTFAAIAKERFLSTSTLKTQASSIYRKLGVTSREEAVSLMKRAGFFT